MQEQVNREREKQNERIVTDTVGMYGEICGIIGATVPQIRAPELGGALLLADEPEG